MTFPRSSHRLLVLAAAIPLVCFSLAGAKRPMTPEDVAGLHSVTAARISPDGKYVAVVTSVPRLPGRDEDGRPFTRLDLIAFADGSSRPFVVGKQEIASVEWCSEDALCFLAKRGSDEHKALYALPIDGGEARRVIGLDSDIAAYAVAPDGSALALIAVEARSDERERLEDQGLKIEIFEEDTPARHLYLARLPEGLAGAAGEATPVEGLDGHPWSVVWSPDSRSMVVDVSPTPLIDDRYMYRRLRVIDAAEMKVLARIDNPGKLGAFRVSPDGGSVVMISAADLHDPGTGRLMIAPLSGGAPRDLLPGLEGDVLDFRFSPKTGKVLYLAHFGTTSALGSVALEGGTPHGLLSEPTPVFRALDADRSGRHLALVGESPTHPAEAFAWTPGTPPRRLTDSNPQLDGIALARQEIIDWRAADGMRIEGLLIHPLERHDDQRVPLIVVAHGGPESHWVHGWLTRYSSPGQVAAGRGYAVFYPNYRGSTGRGVAFAKADQGDAGGKEFDDVLTGIDALIVRGLVDPRRVGITGGSYGGFFTAWASTRHSARFRAGVMFVGISNQLSKAGTTDIPKEMELVHWRTTPYRDLELALDRSPLLHVDQARTPLLILAGKKDRRVDPGQSKELYRALKHKGDVPVRLVFYTEEGHGNRRAAARYDYSLRMMRWLDHFLLEGGSDKPPYRLDYPLLEKSVQ